MASYGPPGVQAPHPSLPARPPPTSATGIGSGGSVVATAGPTPPTAAAYGPSLPAPASASSAAPTNEYGQQQGQARLGYSRTYASVGGPSVDGGAYAASPSYPQQQQPAYSGYGPQAGPQYGPQYGAEAYGAAPGYIASVPPQIQNPFPKQMAPTIQPFSTATGWPSGYGPSSGAGGATAAAYGASSSSSSTYGPTASYGPSSYGPSYGGEAAEGSGGAGYHKSAGTGTGGSTAAADGTTKGEHHKTVYRSGGGKTWADDTLLEWDPSHLRLFVGNLAGEVTDDTLLKAFSRWRSVQKALVKRDKWTKKSRGYGFVSFSDPDDFFQAAKEMNGKYIGSHPVVVRKSKTEIKVAEFKDESAGAGQKNQRGKKGSQHAHAHAHAGATGGGGGGSGSGIGTSGTSTPIGGAGKKHAGSGGGGGKRDPYEPALGPVPTGVHKHGKSKTKNGLKLLG